MRLFDDLERSDTRPGLRTEKSFDILNRSAHPDVVRVREAMERWFGSYPEEGKDELLSRFRSGGPRDFESGFHELFLHELVRGLGCQLEPHPSLPGSPKRPDFLVVSPNHGSSYLEAVVASEFSDEELGIEKAEDDLLDGLDRLETERYYVGITVETRGPKPISQRKFRSFVEKQLSGLDPILVAQQLQAGGILAAQRFRYHDEGWAIELVPMPKSPSVDGSASRLIGIEMGPVRAIDTIAPLRSALKKKGRKYGPLDRPYIIAINAMDMFSDEASMRAALFGTESVSFRTNDTELTVANRYYEGFWAGNSGPQYSRVSGVLYTRRVNPGNLLTGATASLYLNPWASRPYAGELTQLSTVVRGGSDLVRSEGRSIAELLGL